LLEGGNIIYYNRYVDDILIIYNQAKIIPHTLTEHFYAQHKDLHFTINEELNNQKTYLDLNLTNRQGQLEMEMYRKPTVNDVTINKSLVTQKNITYRRTEVGYTDSWLCHSVKERDKGN
jgi:hypothetical protein